MYKKIICEYIYINNFYLDFKQIDYVESFTFKFVI
jgi:hypothetical protein